MIVVLLRIALVVFVVWGLWKLYVAFFSSRRTLQGRAQDEWKDVLDAIDELPETSSRQQFDPDRSQSVKTSHPRSNNSGSQANIESVIIHEAQLALSLIKRGDERDRLAAYHEIRTYEKLCTISEIHISTATWKKVDAIRRQAWDLICRADEP